SWCRIDSHVLPTSSSFDTLTHTVGNSGMARELPSKRLGGGAHVSLRLGKDFPYDACSFKTDGELLPGSGMIGAWKKWRVWSEDRRGGEVKVALAARTMRAHVAHQTRGFAHHAPMKSVIGGDDAAGLNVRQG